MNLAQATYTYHSVADMLEPKLYPSMAAIANVYEEAKRQDKDAEKINPLALWDLHPIRSSTIPASSISSMAPMPPRPRSQAG